MSKINCPAERELLDYALGKVSDQRSEEIDQHLEGCPVCNAALVATQEPSDTLVSVLRQPREPDPYSREPKLREILAVVQAIGRDPSFALPGRGDGDTGLGTERGDHNHPAAPEDLGTIRDYRLLAKLGQGGMGTVYKALHTQLEKIVALKVLPAERLEQPQTVARFKQEMRAVGRLSHPNIVGAHDAGEYEGTHFLVMEYIDGVNLSDLVHALGPLPIADACELIRQAAVGLQHAHEHQLVHRDIKPSNLMLAVSGQQSAVSRQALNADRCLLTATLKILDLGLARLHDGNRAELTSSHQMMGTVDYMAPEQTGDSHAVDIRADIYSLGATLYKLLCDRAPYADVKYNTVVKKLRAMAVEPVPAIQTRRQDVPEELAAVIEKMLAKEPDGRFATPQEVADALVPFAAGADVSALWARYRERRRSERDTAPSAEPTDKGTAEHLSSGMTETWTEQSGHHAPRHEHVAAPLRDAIPLAERAAYGDAAPGLGETGLRGWSRRTKIATVLLGLAGVLAAVMVLRLATDKGEIKIVAYDPQIAVTIKRNNQPVDTFQVKQRPDGTSYYSGEYEIQISGGTPDGVQVKNDKFQLTRGKEVLVEITREVQAAPEQSMAESLPDSSTPEPRPAKPELPAPAPAKPAPQQVWQLGAAEDVLPGIVPRPAKLPGIKRWQVDKNASRTSLYCLASSPDGSRVACGTGDGLIRIYDPKSLTLVGLLLGHKDRVYSVAWNKDGTQLASTAEDGTARVWNSKGECTTVFTEHTGHQNVYCVSWHPDGDRLASCGYEGKVRIWGLDGKEERVIDVLDGNKKPLSVSSVAWSPDGKRLAVGGGFLWDDSTTVLKIWNVDGTEGPTLAGHTRAVLAVAWSPDGSKLASGDYDGTVRTWNADGKAGSILKHTNSVHAIAWAPNGTRVLFGGYGDRETACIANVDGSAAKVLEGHTTTVTAVAWSPDGKQLFTADELGILRSFTDDWRATAVVGDAQDVHSVDWNPADNRLITIAGDWQARTWEATGAVSQRTKVPPRQLIRCRWSPDGQRLAYLDRQSAARIWSFDGSQEFELATSYSLLEWSPDGTRLATAHLKQSNDIAHDEIRIWNWKEGTTPIRLELDARPVAVDWSPNGKQLLVTTDKSVEVWDLQTNQKRVIENASPGSVAWGPDGKWLAMNLYGAGGCFLDLWLAAGGQVPVYRRGQASPNKSSHPISSIAWSPNSRELLTSGFWGVYRWNVSDDPCRPLDGQVRDVRSVAWSADGRLIAAGGGNDLVQVWDAASGDPQWVSIVLADDQNITFHGAGQILHGDPQTIERELVYLVETDAGHLEVLKPSEFQKRIEQAIRVADSAESRSDNPDRRVAEWVLSKGGNVLVDDGIGEWDRASSLEDLPKRPCKLLGVSFERDAISDDDLESLDPAAVRLGHISITGAPRITDRGMRRMGRLRSVTNLSLTGTRVGDAGAEQLLALKDLQTLALDKTLITDAALKSLAQMEKLESLSLNETGITDQGLVHLAGRTSLRKLELQFTKVTDEGLLHLVQLPLTEISVAGTQVGDGGVATLAKLPTIEYPVIGGDKLTDAGLKHLAEYRKLVHLGLRDSPHVTDEGMEYIANLKQLTLLQICNVPITDAGLAKLGELSQLETLDLVAAEITDAGLKHLVTLKSLRSLDFGYCKRVTPAGMAKLHEALPQCRITKGDFVIEPKAE